MALFIIDDISLCLRLKSLQMEAKESFDQLCKQLQLEEGSKERAWNVWESVSTKVVETAQVNTLITCMCYLVLKHG